MHSGHAIEPHVNMLSDSSLCVFNQTSSFSLRRVRTGTSLALVQFVALYFSFCKSLFYNLYSPQANIFSQQPSVPFHASMITVIAGGMKGSRTRKATSSTNLTFRKGSPSAFFPKRCHSLPGVVFKEGDTGSLHPNSCAVFRPCIISNASYFHL